MRMKEMVNPTKVIGWFSYGLFWACWVGSKPSQYPLRWIVNHIELKPHGVGVPFYAIFESIFI